MSRLQHNRFIQLVFFGNYFYGLCAVALSIEATLQQRFPLNQPLFYILVFSATVLYYTKAYVITETPDHPANLRAGWYARNRRLITNSQRLFLITVLFCSALFAMLHWQQLAALGILEYALILLFPLVSALYYGISGFNLRNIGWLKPFIIGFSWAGMVTIYPILFYCADKGLPYEVTLAGCFLFVKNFMFITVLCIMFDIKDYGMDYNQQLKTFVVNVGLRKTLFYIIFPLCMMGLASFLVYALSQHFSIFKILINTIPFILIIAVTYSLHNRQSIFYYLAIIDGLMLVKAFCGITAMLFF